MQAKKLINWDSSLKFDIPTIDSQHEKIVIMINSLFTALQNPEEQLKKVTAKKVLKELFAYVIIHFRYEEELLEKVKWDKAAEHIAMHKELSIEVDKLVKANDTSHEATKSLVLFLVKWVKTHIDKEDRQYVELLK